MRSRNSYGAPASERLPSTNQAKQEHTHSRGKSAAIDEYEQTKRDSPQFPRVLPLKNRRSGRSSDFRHDPQPTPSHSRSTVVAIVLASFPVTAAGPQRIFTVFPILRASDTLAQHPSPVASLNDSPHLSTANRRSVAHVDPSLRQRMSSIMEPDWIQFVFPAKHGIPTRPERTTFFEKERCLGSWGTLTASRGVTDVSFVYFVVGRRG